ncbi:MAG: prolipoprotein diacylglyceryl transferase [Planctomycetes bacterium]|nr:prolipoprotein diacylglyceryl transferase [Planctomycetota bacterium]
MHPELFTIPGIHLTVPSYGAMVLIAFLGSTWCATRRARRVKADPDIILNLAFISLVTSTIGARAFYVIHYWKDQFADQPRRIFELQAGGFEIYGGVIAAFVCCLLYGLIRRLPCRLYADIIAPSLLLGMGIGRIGCLLFGCCWGGTCSAHLPWAVQFPFGSPPFNRQWENRQVTVPAELILVDSSGMSGPFPRSLMKNSVPDLRDKLAKAEEGVAKAQAAGDEKKLASATRMRSVLERGLEPILGHYERFDDTPDQLLAMSASPEFRTLPLHPSQLYGAIGPILLAFLLNAYFYRRPHHGTVMPLGFILYAVERFIEEAIRSDNPHDTFGLTISQGVSVGVLLVCLLVLLAIRQMPPRAANVKPWVPVAAKPKPATATESVTPAG